MNAGIAQFLFLFEQGRGVGIVIHPGGEYFQTGCYPCFVTVPGIGEPQTGYPQNALHDLQFILLPNDIEIGGYDTGNGILDGSPACGFAHQCEFLQFFVCGKHPQSVKNRPVQRKTRRVTGRGIISRSAHGTVGHFHAVGTDVPGG